MPLATVTSTTLLQGLRDPANRTLWLDFVERYRPLLLAFMRRAGLADADAEDVAQEVLGAFAQGYREGRYDRDRGRLRAWLFGIAARQLASWRRSRAGLEQRRQESTRGFEPVAEDGLELLWEEEWRRAVVSRCLAEVERETDTATAEAFRRFALENRPAEEVAAELGLTANAVYCAKYRVLKRLRELQPLMEDVF